MTEITMKEKKLGQYRAIGLAFPEEKLFYIDPRLDRDKMIEIIIHESLHILGPWLTEEAVIDWSESIAPLIINACEEKKYFKNYV